MKLTQLEACECLAKERVFGLWIDLDRYFKPFERIRKFCIEKIWTCSIIHASVMSRVNFDTWEVIVQSCRVDLFGLSVVNQASSLDQKTFGQPKVSILENILFNLQRICFVQSQWYFDLGHKVALLFFNIEVILIRWNLKKVGFRLTWRLLNCFEKVLVYGRLV